MRIELLAFSITLSLVLLCGCSTQTVVVPAELEYHVVVSDTEGRYVVPTGNESSLTPLATGIKVPRQELLFYSLRRTYEGLASDATCEPSHDDNTVGKHLAGVIRSICEQYNEVNGNRDSANQRRFRIVIFAHGGLNSHGKALEAARDDLCEIGIYNGDEYLPDGCEGLPEKESRNQHSEYVYPLFLAWETGPLNSYYDNLFRIRRGRLAKDRSQLSLALTGLVHFGFDTASALVNSPRAMWNHGAHVFKESPESCQPNEPSHMVGVPFIDPTRKCENILTSRALRALDFPLNTVGMIAVDSYGGRAWSVMNRRAHLLYHHTDTDSENIIGPMEYLTRVLEHAFAKGGVLHNKEIEIDLIGHSMGAIVINQLIGEKPGIPIKNIVHMASADTILSIDEIVMPYLMLEESVKNGVKFYSLALHPRREHYERADGLLGFVAPRGSLLTYIDNLYNDYQTINDRTSGTWENIRYWVGNNRFSDNDQLKDRVSFRVFAYDGKWPKKHGEFRQIRYWNRDCWLASSKTSSQLNHSIKQTADCVRE